MMLSLLVFGFLCAPGEGPNYECAENSLYTSLLVLGMDCDISSLRQRLQAYGVGNSLADLAKAAKDFGVFPLALRFDVRLLDDLPVGSIIHTDTPSGHFSTYLGIENGLAILGNAPMPLVRVPRKQLIASMSGNVLLLFETKAELQSYKSHLQTKRWEGYLSLSLLVIVFLLCVFLWMPTRRKKTVMVLFLIALTGCQETLDMAPTHKTAFPSSPLDAGFVPVSGKTFSIPLYNPYDIPIRIVGVTASCGCTNVGNPGVIPPGEEVKVEVDIAGDKYPINRRVTIVVETEEHGNHRVYIDFGTGATPQLLLPYVTFSFIRNRLTADASLWLNGKKAVRVVIEQSDFEVTIQPGEQYTVDSLGKALTLNDSGLIDVNIQFVLGSHAKSKGTGNLVYKTGDELVTQRVDYRIQSDEAVSLSPDTATICCTSNSPQERVFMCSADFAFTPSVTSCPKSCSARFEQMSDRCWKLIVEVDLLFAKREAVHEVKIEVEFRANLSGRLFSDSCSVKIIGSDL